jgi:DMSO/TMAO reductase YedYZ heme-binding membrane subunit
VALAAAAVGTTTMPLVTIDGCRSRPVNANLWWYVARSTGLVAWALAAASVLWGMALSTRALGKRPKAPWLLELHRFLGGLTMLFVLAHVGAVLADTLSHFAVLDVLIPFRRSWSPRARDWGILSVYLLLAVEVTSLLRSRVPKRLWRFVHFTSYGVYVLASIHFLAAGTDAGVISRAVIALSLAATVFFLVYIVVGPGKAASVASKAGAARSVAAKPAAGTRGSRGQASERIPAAARQASATERMARIAPEAATIERIPAATRRVSALPESSDPDSTAVPEPGSAIDGSSRGAEEPRSDESTELGATGTDGWDRR